MSFPRGAARSTDRVVSATPLRHNPLNAVTANVERITDKDGHTYIRKELRRPAAAEAAEAQESARQSAAPGTQEPAGHQSAGPGAQESAGPQEQEPTGAEQAGAQEQESAGPDAQEPAGSQAQQSAGQGTGRESGGRAQRLETAAARAVEAASGRVAAGWAGSGELRHWNYWRREVEVYQDAGLRARLEGTGLALPEGEVEESPGGAVLYLEDIDGRPGTEFTLEDHAALARAFGRWQAQPAPERAWTSKGFLRDYSTTREVPWEVLDDDAAWRQPLVADNWPAGLHSSWEQLVAHRGELLTIVEQSPRAECHLDLWVSNAIRRPDGEIALLDWAFTGDGALGEDIGNHIPDAVFDLFWPAEQIAELAETCVSSYLEGLREGGWRGEPEVVRRAVMASMVKYAWLLPLVLSKASDTSHGAYHQPADSQRLFQQRGLAFSFVAEWAAEALKG